MMRFVRTPRALAQFLCSALAAGAVAWLVTACGSPRGSGAGASTPRPAPDFVLEDVHGRLVRLSDSAGRVRLVDFWATWCPPCIEAIPDLKALHEAYGDRGLTVLAISMDDDPGDVVPSFVRRNKVPYANLLGNPDIADAFGGVVGLPTTFLVDRDGTITNTYVGGIPKEVLERRIRELLDLGAAL